MFLWGFILAYPYEDEYSIPSSIVSLCVTGISGSIFIILFLFLLIPLTTSGYSKSSFSKNFTFKKMPTELIIEYPTKSGDIKTLYYNDIERYLNVEKMRLKYTKYWNYYGLFQRDNVQLVK